MRRPLAVFIGLFLWICGSPDAILAQGEKPVWIVSNGFHSSLALRVRDVPFAHEIEGDLRASALLFGWGAADYYQGKTDAWTLVKTVIWPSPSVLHVVPINGAVATRFSHSDVIELSLPAFQFRLLLGQLDEAFARDGRGRRIMAGRGDYANSRFYAGSERFYFPKMCNVWVAQKLRRSGLRICVPAAIAASELTWQASKLGRQIRWCRPPVDRF